MNKIKLLGLCLIFMSIIIPLSSFTVYQIKEQNYQVKLEKNIKSKNYYAILEIEKINLKKQLYAIDSKENNVDKNILVHKNSIFPDNVKSNIILLAHSGNGQHAYFQNLYKLKNKDEIIIYYQDYTWIYEIYDIEYQNKTGILYLKEDFEKMITLITCTKDNSKLQTIYYGYLKNKLKN